MAAFSAAFAAASGGKRVVRGGSGSGVLGSLLRCLGTGLCFFGSSLGGLGLRLRLFGSSLCLLGGLAVFAGSLCGLLGGLLRSLGGSLRGFGLLLRSLGVLECLAGILGGLLCSLDGRQQIGVVLLGLDELVIVADLGLQARGQRVIGSAGSVDGVLAVFVDRADGVDESSTSFTAAASASAA